MAVVLPPPLFGPELLGPDLVGPDQGPEVNVAALQADLKADLDAATGTVPFSDRGPRRSRTGGPRAPGLITVGRAGTSRTVADAVDNIRALMERQIARAKEDSVKPNEVADGDGPVRVTFYTVLPYAQQRSLFLEMASQQRVWPRLRGLFGAPPYQFLGPEDAWALRAAGIAHNRTNMGYENTQAAANYSQFGAGHYIDDHEREYRVLPTDRAKLTDPLPWMLQERNARDLRLEVRVKKRDKKRKLELLRDRDGRAMLTFPSPGDQVELVETNRLLSIQNKRYTDASRPTIKIRRVVPRGEHSATAAVFATVI